MANQIEKMSADVEQVSKLSDQPNQTDGLTAQELKAVFDKGSALIKEYVNDTLVPAINELVESDNKSVKEESLQSVISSTLTQAKNSGAFDGEDGNDGKSAYEYAKDGGYAGTEEEFAAKMAAELPSKVSQLTNDAGYITKAVEDLVNYYRKSEVYTQDEVKALVSAIPKFGISVVAALPTDEISETTVYLVPGGDGEDLYTEYIYVSGVWEILGCQKIKSGLTVTFTGSASSGYAADKTFTEVSEALSAGTTVTGVLSSAALDIVLDNVIIENERGYCSFNGQVRRYAGGNAIPIESITAILHANNTVELLWENIITAETVGNYLPTNLPNPNALTIGEQTYDGSLPVDMTAQVNALIDEKLGVIENGSY